MLLYKYVFGLMLFSVIVYDRSLMHNHIIIMALPHQLLVKGIVLILGNMVIHFFQRIR